MKFSFEKRPEIHKLAWCAEIRKGDDTVRVTCGSAVECRDDFFCAGVWDGDFDNGDFANAHFACCTGAKIERGGGVRLSTPNHPQEAIFSIDSGETLRLSNSLPFLLVESGEHLDEKFPDYEKVLCHFLFGLRKPQPPVPLASGKTAKIYRCCNIDIDSSLQVTTTRKTSNLSFADYADYRAKLVQILTAIKENATSDSRSHKYGMITTISRGYDAPATSALAREIGCNRAFTFSSPPEDCGLKIAHDLGIADVMEGDPLACRKNEKLFEAGACSTGEVGVTVVFFQYENLYSNSLMFLGCKGDSIWSRSNPNVNDDYDFSHINGLALGDSSYTENFLKNNTVAIFVPLCGADKWSEIHKISSSSEMAKFSVGGDYDRPIPRRILEEAGIARNEFGQTKRGVGFSFFFDTLASMRKKMSPASFDSFCNFVRSRNRSRVKYMARWALHVCCEFPAYFNWLSAKFGLPLKIKEKHRASGSPLSSPLILWGVHEMMKRYAKQK